MLAGSLAGATMADILVETTMTGKLVGTTMVYAYESRKARKSI